MAEPREWTLVIRVVTELTDEEVQKLAKEAVRKLSSDDVQVRQADIGVSKVYSVKE